MQQQSFSPFADFWNFFPLLDTLNYEKMLQI